MEGKKSFSLILIAMAVTVLTAGCNVNGSESEERLTPPDTYEFFRNGESTVSYPGQTDRLNMVEEMKAYVSQANNGEVISEQALLDMFENKDGNGGGYFSFTSDRQLKNKTFAPDLDSGLFEGIFADAQTASDNGSRGIRAANGVAGLIEREESGKDILVDARGREFTQLIEKGLMGAVFYSQIFNVYLTDDRIGPNVENQELRDGTNYTDKEHHFDEAYGYFDAPVDFKSDWPESRENELRFWSNYSNGSDELLGFNDTIMQAFIYGRTAIVNNDQDELDEQVDILYHSLELLAAATAVHYINGTLQHLNNGYQGEALHTLSEAWAFVNALKYSPRRSIALDQIDQILNSDFGENGNFWNVTAQGLNNAKTTLVSVYPELEPVQDQL
jgi:hypothetical protein